MNGDSMTMMQLMHEGGWVMWGLLGFSIAAVATALERALVLHRARLEVEPFLRALRKTLMEKGPKAALALCHDHRGPAARLAEAALRVFERAPAQLEKVMERHARREERMLYRRLGILASIATTAPLLGFLGTVTGMMASFEVLGNLGITDPGAVATGIKEALTTTAGGLVVAVPTQLVYNALRSRAERITDDLETVGNVLLELREELG
ncbi:MAG: MotA/TolQ/ExbB proton channel family protein [Acidobacteriota bacterium]